MGRVPLNIRSRSGTGRLRRGRHAVVLRPSRRRRFDEAPCAGTALAHSAVMTPRSRPDRARPDPRGATAEYHDEYSETLGTEFRKLQDAFLSDTVSILATREPIRLPHT